MERWSDAVYDYIERLTRFNDPLLGEMEERAGQTGFPIVGPLVGPWLYFLTRITGARRVFEMGSGFGYSTYFFASALRDNGGGTVTHTVWDADLSREAQQWLERAGLSICCDFQVSEAVLALTSEAEPLDIVFLDIDKEMYPGAEEVISQRLRPGGLLLVDNTIWQGKACDPAVTDEATRGVRAINDRLSSSPRWQYVLNPLRDGLGVARFNG
jgi:predicted O-methyltransferase YrrM